MTGKPIEAFGRDASRLDGEATKAAVCEADAPNTSPMDKTVEVSQAARELVPCPFCGSQAFVETNEAAIEEWGIVQAGCTKCGALGPFVDSDVPEPALLAAQAWNTRATQPEAALREALEAIDIQALEGEAGEALDAWDQEHGLSYGACFSIVSGIILDALKDHRHG